MIRTTFIRTSVFLFFVSSLFTLFAQPPVAQWTFNAGTEGKISGNVSSEDGKSGKGISLDGTTGYATFALPPLSGDFTFDLWAKPHSVPGLQAAIFGRRGFHNDLGYDSKGRFYFEIFNTDKKGFVAVSEKSYPVNEWHRLTGTFEASKGKIKLYIDGELAGEASFSGTVFPYPAEATAGVGNPSSQKYAFWFCGMVDEIRVWNRALDAGEIKNGDTGTGGPSFKWKAHYAFENVGQGKILDSLGQSPELWVSSQNKWSQGIVGTSLEFVGKSFYGLIKDLSLPGPFTVMAWVKPTTVPTGVAAMVGRPGFHNSLAYTSSKRFQFELYNREKKGFTALSAASFEPGEWHLVAGVFDPKAGKVLLFVDGIKSGEVDFSGELFPYANDWNVACASPASPSFGYWFTGHLDELRFASQAITAQELQSIWDSEKNKQGPAQAPHYGQKVGNHGQPRQIEPSPVDAFEPVSESLIAEIKSRGPQSAKVIQTQGGSPILQVNGKDTLFYGGDVWCFHPYSSINIQPYFKAGMEIINLQLSLGLLSEEGGWGANANSFMKPYWAGKNKYESGELEKILWRPLQGNRSAKIVIWLMIDPYLEWTKEHPDELMMNEKGEYAFGEMHTVGFTNEIFLAGPNNRNRVFWSFQSQVFRDQVSDMLRSLVKDIESRIPGNAVIGYMIGGGQDAQLYHWHSPNTILASSGASWGDYSPASLAAWKNWLEKKYATPKALSAAWGMPVASFQNAKPPSSSELMGGNTFHDPVTERRAMDWKRFNTDGRARLLETFAKTIKAASSRQVVVGACVGDSGSRRDLTIVEDMNRLPEMDFYLHQATYGQRLPPNLGGINAHLASVAANKKIFCVDWDHPTFMQTPAAAHSIGTGISHTSKFQGWAKDIATLRTMWRRDISHLWATGAGVLWDHVFGQPHAFDDPSIIDEMKFLVDTAKVFKPSTVSSPVAEVALIYDEKNVDYLRQGLQTINYTWARIQQDELLASGVPYAAWLMDDLRRGKIPAHKLYIFQNALDLNPENAAAIEKLKKGGATLVFLRDTGWAQSESSPETVSKVMGMTMSTIERAGRSKVGWQSGHPLAQWRESSFQADPVVWPVTWQAFGPVEKSDAPPSEKELASLQTQLTSGGKTFSPKIIQSPGGYINLADALGLKAREGIGAWLFAEVSSASERTVEMGAGADWWMEWFVNGTKVYDTLSGGNGSGSFDIRNHRFKIQLKKGTNVLAVRVLSGSGGFVLTSGGPNELKEGRSFEAGREGIKVEPQFTLVPVDPKAVLLAPYPGTEQAGYAVREHEDWKSVFVGNRLLSRFMISALARYAGAWRVTSPETVVQAGQNFLMLHSLDGGIKNISWKREAVFTPWGSEGNPIKGKDIKLDLKSGETYLYKVE